MSESVTVLVVSTRLFVAKGLGVKIFAEREEKARAKEKRKENRKDKDKMRKQQRKKAYPSVNIYTMGEITDNGLNDRSQK